ncbi:MAG: 6-pyruvoyl-tetrahydropterin synthase-related protein [Anaerolineae bacterium]
MPALIPLMRCGFFESHDGLFHLYRLVALDRAVRAGVFYPRWFPEFAFGYGHPVLNFYGPLSYYWGLPFTLLGLDTVWAMKLVLAIGLVASALGMYWFARLHLPKGSALVAAVVYAYLPYHLIDLYIRGAVAEFLAFVWMPLVLGAFHRLVEESGKYRFRQLAAASLSLAALVSTHSLSTLIFAPVLAGYLLLLLGRRGNWRAIGHLVTAFVLTLLLSAFYWLPVLTESGYVGLGHGVSQGYRDHLLSPGELVSAHLLYDYSLNPAIPIAFPLGWVQIGFLMAACILPGSRPHRPFALFFLAIALFSIFMLTTVSFPIWRLLEPVLAFLQYPWRFQALTVLATAFLSGALLTVLPRLTARGAYLLGCLIVLVTGTWAMGSLPVRGFVPDLSLQGMWRTDQSLGQIGATWTGEYLPIWVQEQRWAISYPAPEPTIDLERSLNGQPALGPGTLQLTGVGYTSYEFILNVEKKTTLTLHQFYYPGWKADWLGETIPARPARVLGLAAFDLPPGSGPLIVHLALTPAQWWGTVLSTVALLALGVACVKESHRLPRQELGTCSAWIAGCLLAAAILLSTLVQPNGRVQAATPVNANLQNLVELQAFSIERTRYHPGDTVEVTLYWTAFQELDQDYKTFIHLTDAEVTQQPTQHDDDPGGSFTPTSRWLPGELVPDTHYLVLPDELPPGRYNLWADMYEYPSVRNLSVLSANAPHDGKRVLLTQIRVVAP